MSTRPNILLIVFDTARADAFEPYGADRGTTPAVAQLASAGTAVDRAYATASWTVPSHASLFGGGLPRTIGFDHRGGMLGPGFQAAVNANRDRFLPSWLGTHGYERRAVSTNLWVSRQSGLDAGFEHFAYLPPRRNNYMASRRRRDLPGWLLEGFRARVDDGAASVEAMLHEWLARPARRPFFWFVNLVECHSPYLPPRPYNELGGLARARAAWDASQYETLEAIWRSSLNRQPLPEDAVQRIRQLYLGAIRLMDAWLGRVLEALDDHGVLDETQVIVTSDHGENLGDGDLFGHCFSLDDRLIRVPLLLQGPMTSPTEQVFSLGALPGWIGQAVAPGEHPWTDSWTVPGVAVAQLDAPGDGNLEETEASVRSWGVGDAGVERFATSLVVATNGQRKLVRRLGQEELFNLVSDPLEQRPQAVDARLEAAFADELQPLRAALDHAAATERPPVAEELRREAIDDAEAAERTALEDQMKLLGYL